MTAACILSALQNSFRFEQQFCFGNTLPTKRRTLIMHTRRVEFGHCEPSTGPRMAMLWIVGTGLYVFSETAVRKLQGQLGGFIVLPVGSLLFLGTDGASSTCWQPSSAPRSTPICAQNWHLWAHADRGPKTPCTRKIRQPMLSRTGSHILCSSGHSGPPVPTVGVAIRAQGEPTVTL